MSIQQKILELFAQHLQALGFVINIDKYVHHSKPFLEVCKDIQTQPIHNLVRNKNKLLYTHPIYGTRSFQLLKVVAKGDYGCIYSSQWENNVEELYIKQSPIPLLKEALLQIMSYCVLEVYNFPWVIPKVNDIFSSKEFGNMFTMIPTKDSRIYKNYLEDHYKRSPCIENDIMIFEIVCQLALYNYILEKEIGFNHRDLRTPNILMICPNDSQKVLQHTIDGYTIEIYAQNHALIVDFGNSCIPQTENKVYTPSDQYALDNTPKAGRDLFQMLAYLYNEKFIRDGLTEKGRALFHYFLQGSTRNWADFLLEEKYSKEENFKVIYMMTFGFKFFNHQCSPFALLEKISSVYIDLVKFEKQE